MSLKDVKFPHCYLDVYTQKNTGWTKAKNMYVYMQQGIWMLYPDRYWLK